MRTLLLDTETPGIPQERGVMNINGPSLIRVPDWVSDPLGRYYLYFAHHSGAFIRLAYADDLLGPYTVYEPGALHLGQTPCIGHIASPDVHVVNGEIRMYFHGLVSPEVDTLGEFDIPYSFGKHQRTFVAVSTDGLHFKMYSDEILGPSYFRVWQQPDAWYALGMPGAVFRSVDGLHGFVRGPNWFDSQVRHTAVAWQPHTLRIYLSRVGDTPERIRSVLVDTQPDWLTWQPSALDEVIRPVMDFEGVHLPIEASTRGAVHQPVHALRDPAIYTEAGRTWLLYSVAGEQGIAITELVI